MNEEVELVAMAMVAGVIYHESIKRSILMAFFQQVVPLLLARPHLPTIHLLRGIARSRVPLKLRNYFIIPGITPIRASYS